jgi:hypothetical protein
LTGVAVNVTEVPTQTAPEGDAAIVTAGVTLALTFIAMALLVAVRGEAQGSLLVMTAVTTSPLARVVVVNVAVTSPGTAVPLTRHTYVGVVPPLTGAAVNVTLPPTHIDVVVALMLTAGVTLAAVIVMALLVAVRGVAQGSLLVMTEVTTSPFARVVVVNVAVTSPGTAVPLTRHT